MRTRITYKIAMAAGADAANKQMKAAGRNVWNEDDMQEACRVSHMLFPAIPDYATQELTDRPS